MIEGHLYFIIVLLPVLALTALLFACFGWFIRGRHSSPGAEVDTQGLQVEQARSAALEQQLLSATQMYEELQAQLNDVYATTVPRAEIDGLSSLLQTEQYEASNLRERTAQLSKELEAARNQLNESNRKNQTRLFELESELSRSRQESAELRSNSELAAEPKLAELEAELSKEKQAASTATTALAQARQERDELIQKLQNLEQAAKLNAVSTSHLFPEKNPETSAVAVLPSGTKMTEASNLMGKRIAKDDLKIIEGIGPKIEQLLFTAGITTWKKLSETSTAALKDVLNSGGEHFSLHTPTSWPSQALLAEKGRWKELKSLQNQLERGKKKV